MSSMSYCLFENTASELGRCVERMEEANSITDLDFSQYEKAAFYEMWRTCRDFLAEHERLLNASVDLNEEVEV
jgi:exonuclease VII small subunit